MLMEEEQRIACCFSGEATLRGAELLMKEGQRSMLFWGGSAQSAARG